MHINQINGDRRVRLQRAEVETLQTHDTQTSEFYICLPNFRRFSIHLEKLLQAASGQSVFHAVYACNRMWGTGRLIRNGKTPVCAAVEGCTGDKIC